MYLPTAFAWTDLPSITAFCRAHAFATVIAEGSAGPEAQHIPLLVEPAAHGQGLVLHGHAALGNPLWRAAEALAVFHGPHAYVSAAWYAEGDTVPTWNYLAVHARGTLTAIEDAAASTALFARLAAAMGDPDTTTWQERLSPEVAARLSTGIRWFRIDATAITGKAKLSQNHPETRRQRVIDRLRTSADPQANATGAAMARVLAGGQPWLADGTS
jgi:transcriptional regulator